MEKQCTQAQHGGGTDKWQHPRLVWRGPTHQIKPQVTWMGN